MTGMDMEQINFGEVAPENEKKSLDDVITVRDIARLLACDDKARRYCLAITTVLNNLPDANNDGRLRRYADHLGAFATVSALVGSALGAHEAAELRRTWRYALDLVHCYGPNTAKVLLDVLD